MSNLKDRHLKLLNADSYDDPAHKANFEKSLETALEANFSEIFDSKYELLSRQYEIKAEGEVIGKIDLLAYNTKTGALVAIELKKDTGHYDSVGQLALYMGWLRLNHTQIINEFEQLKDSKKHNEIEGIILCSTPDIRLYYATMALKDIVLYSYGYDPLSGIFGLIRYTKLKQGTLPTWKDADNADSPIEIPNKKEAWSKVAEINAN